VENNTKSTEHDAHKQITYESLCTLNIDWTSNRMNNSDDTGLYQCD